MTRSRRLRERQLPSDAGFAPAKFLLYDSPGARLQQPCGTNWHR